MSKSIFEKLKLEDCYNLQISYQRQLSELIQKGDTAIPADNPDMFSYHMCALLEELGEILKADKRWKTHRNAAYNRSEKYEEYADVLITVFNLAIFSGMSYKDICEQVSHKIADNMLKLEDNVKRG